MPNTCAPIIFACVFYVNCLEYRVAVYIVNTTVFSEFKLYYWSMGSCYKWSLGWIKLYNNYCRLFFFMHIIQLIFYYINYKQFSPHTWCSCVKSRRSLKQSRRSAKQRCWSGAFVRSPQFKHPSILCGITKVIIANYYLGITLWITF